MLVAWPREYLRHGRFPLHPSCPCAACPRHVLEARPCACPFINIALQIGSGAHVGTPTLSVDRPTGRGAEREKKAIAIGSKALVGFRAHLGAGCTVGNDAMVNQVKLIVVCVRFGHGLHARVLDTTSLCWMSRGRNFPAQQPQRALHDVSFCLCSIDL